jgi:hypothetical protein
MAEFGVNLNFDDGGISDRLNKSADLFDKLAKEVKDLDTQMKATGKSSVAELSKITNETTGLLSTFSKTGEAINKAFKSSKQDIGAVALEIAKNSLSAEKLNTIFAKLEKARISGIAVDLDDIETALTDVISEVRLTDEQMDILVNNIDEVAAALATIPSGELEGTAQKAEVLTKEFATAKQELRALTNAITSGQLKGDDLVEARTRAAQLTDEIGDIREQIRNLSSDTRGIDTLIEGTRAVAAGFSIAEGAAALFGDENEDMQKALVKLNAIMAVSNGLQEAHALLLQNSNLRMRAAAISQGLYTTVVGTSSGALKVFKIALASTGIGLLVILLGTLVANWDKIKKSVDNNSKSLFEYGKKITTLLPPLNLLIKGIEFLYNNFDRLDNIASGVIDGVVAGLGAIGEVVSKIFDGDFTGAYNAAKQVGAKIGAATREGIALADKADANLAVAKEIDGIVANQKKKLEVLSAGGRETNKLQKNILDNELKALRLANADKEKIAEKEQEILVFNAERQKDAADKAKEAREKQIADAKKSYDEYINELNKINNEAKTAQRANQIDAIDDSSIQGQIERLQLQQQFDREDLEERKRITLEKVKDAQQRTTLTEAFKALEIELSAKYNKELIDLERKSRDDYKKTIEANANETNEIIRKAKIEEANARLEGNLRSIQFAEDIQLADIERELKYGKLSVDQRRELERQKLEIVLASLQAQRAAFGLTVNEDTIKLDSLIKDAQAGLKSFDEQLKPAFRNAGDLFKNYLQDAFKIDDEQFGALTEGFGALKNAILDVVNAGYEAEINALDESISAREDRISDLESLIEEELDKKNQGYANDYDALLAQKADEELLLKEDNKKRLEIQREQLRNETAIQAAQQVGALVTAVANMVASGSKLGIFGLPLIAASVIGLFALYRNYKSQVKALGQSAFKGGKISDYLEPGQSAKSDRPGYGEGHRVEGTNLRIGADEFLVNAVTTSKHLPFLKEFNKGSFDNIDFMKAVNKAPDKSVLVKVVREQERKDKAKAFNGLDKDTLKEVIKEQTNEILDMERKKPIVINLPNGDVEMTYITKNGVNTRVIKRG